MDATQRTPDPDQDEVSSVPVPGRSNGNDPGRAARWAAWQAENADAIASWNTYIEQHGLPLARYRQF